MWFQQSFFPYCGVRRAGVTSPALFKRVILALWWRIDLRRARLPEEASEEAAAAMQPGGGGG